jgi:tRNA1Val (adenine37-N6)-methyltransferase
MSKSFFQFKAFGIHQDRCAMKVGTDGVVLGALAGEKKAVKMLEVGVGTGVISLMMAQRYDSLEITGVEIDWDAWDQASGNAANSPWSARINFLHQRFQDYSHKTSDKFDLIVSNPPYFSNHLKSLDLKRNIALHHDSLTFPELLSGVEKLLAPKGAFWLILPPDIMKQMQGIAASRKMYLNKQIYIRDRVSKPILRTIGRFSFLPEKEESSELLIKDQDGTYSAAYSNLLRDYLLIF